MHWMDLCLSGNERSCCRMSICRYNATVQPDACSVSVSTHLTRRIHRRSSIQQYLRNVQESSLGSKEQRCCACLNTTNQHLHQSPCISAAGRRDANRAHALRWLTSQSALCSRTVMAITFNPLKHRSTKNGPLNHAWLLHGWYEEWTT